MRFYFALYASILEKNDKTVSFFFSPRVLV
jgi:hypothetical protein